MAIQTAAAAPGAPAHPQPWWKFGMAWMTFGLPLVAVVAATLSAVIAVRGADPVVEEYKQKNAREAAEDATDRGRTADPYEAAELARNRASIKRH